MPLPGITSALIQVTVSDFSGDFLQYDTDLNNTTSYTFASQSLGSAPSGIDRRHIVVAVATQRGDFHSINSVTLGGSAVTEIIARDSETCPVWIGAIEVPSGTTANVVVNTSIAPAGAAIALWRLINWSGSAHDTASHGGTSPINLAIDVPANGLIVAAAGVRNGSLTWSNATQRFQGDLDTSDRSTFADYTATGAETNRAVSASATGSIESGVAASFGG